MRVLLALFLCLMAFTAAHVNHEVESDEVRALKRQFNLRTRGEIAKCSEKFARSGLHARAISRRQATIDRHRASLQRRDTDTVLNTSHHSVEQVGPNTTATSLFNKSSICVLNPEGETGPFYVPGEHIRSNLRESQPGIPIVLEGQFIDVETCEPITDLWWDLWNCNSTGVYAGVVEQGNGNANDASNINATFLRGLQKTDSDGVVTFESIFPGHYSGRATHHHMVAHLNATIQPNSTITGGHAVHIGQAFWDQDLISKVESTYPYNTNNITITTNAEDRVFSDETKNTTSDPVFEYTYLGSKLEDGIFGWLTIAVNISATYDPNYSFAYTSSGGVEESGGTNSVNGGNGTAPGNGTGPGGGGAMPTGAVPSTSLARRSFDVDWR